MKKVTERREFEAINESVESFLLFKHSLTCPISKAAFEEFRKYVKGYPEVPAYYLAVQDSRPLSNYIESFYAIKHESPQIFYIDRGRVKWHTSHWNIRKEAIEQAVKKQSCSNG